VVLFVLLRSIPYLGWAVEVVAVVLGLGGLWLALRRRAPAVVQTAEQAM
jgi:cytochrome c-type biogenesis protein CcmH/NrfF